MRDVIRWGILAPGKISHKFIKGLSVLKDAQVAAVGSRSMERAADFAKQYNIPKAYGSYEELVNDPDIDIVYVATPHPSHKDCTLLCLKAGKAVLCEKPFTVNTAEAEEVIKYAREKKLFLMEAMWTRYKPTTVKAREWLSQGAIGEVRMLKADFGFRGEWNPEGRLLNPELGGGALLDVGIYPVSFASMIFGTPVKISSMAHIGETGVDEQFSVLLGYEGGKIACLNGAVRTDLVNDVWIFGTEGSIHLPNFIWAKSAILSVKGKEPVVYEPEIEGNGYNYEAEEAMRCLREGKLESEIMPLDETISIMKTMDRIREEWQPYNL
jgi:dihydrodiol dehydrogenase / D-xylose 1-dehydrogenase (NADP)